jgi:carbon storage regulator
MEGVMLVLSRKLGQTFQIGQGVRITVVKIDNNTVRIGIDAPDDVSIKRQEIAFEVPELLVKETAGCDSSGSPRHRSSTLIRQRPDHPHSG